MKLGLLTIDGPNINLGNRLIEYSIFSLLDLPKPNTVISMFKELTDKDVRKLNSCDLVIIPGSTVFAKAKKNSDAMKYLKKTDTKKICVSGSGWEPRYPTYVQALKFLTPPIGCRDPHIYSMCKKNKIKAVFTGCPTAYLPKRDSNNEDYLIGGLARDGFDWQLSLFNRVKKEILFGLQEPKFERKKLKFGKKKYKTFTYDDPDAVISYFSKCKGVITGRLHSVLPALSQQKRVVFFGHKNDSRFSLLKYLNIPINEIGGPFNKKFILPEQYSSQLEKLRENFYSWAENFGIGRRHERRSDRIVDL